MAEAEKKRTRSVDKMNKMLDEMLQDRVETGTTCPGQVVRGKQRSVRLASGQKLDSLPAPVHNPDPLRQSPTSGPVEETKAVPTEG